ncbi:hypothetical protein [Lacticaseibacillus camelliae]|uniref:Uncharacterized protein n=1 Tax=Lacticaseibacillus camelliae DSM 22697 = JCM 13995 TaxID=1423730 RepID=A0A0R2F1R7_9LACO|nr:hypothetical protein [Lacticaseibacillus camelliae]KRN18180.1 hypothetical protein FC75_GL000872 [Lacticaseibacillus camelliae DSM 22697 = JCM 13995]
MYTYSKQQLFFTAEMCLGMGSLMSGLNILFRLGLTAAALTTFLSGWTPTILIAFAWNLTIAAPAVNLLINVFATTPEHALDPVRAQRIHQWATIIIMCLSMSTWGMVMAGALPGIPVSALLITWARSFVLAYAIRGLLVRPAATAFSHRIFPG